MGHVDYISLNLYQPAKSFSNTYTKQVLNINFAKPKLLIKDNTSIAPQKTSSKLPMKRNPIFISDPATRVRLTKNNSAFATRIYHSNLLPPNTINSDSEHAMRVRLTQNNSKLAKHSQIKIAPTLIVQNLIALSQREYI